MRLKRYFQLLMVVIFLFTFQKITIHSKQHLSEGATKCHLCHVSEYLDTHHQQESSALTVNEHFAIKERKVEEKQIIQDAFDLTQNPPLRMVDFDGLNDIEFDRPLLGYFSTAPPTIFS